MKIGGERRKNVDQVMMCVDEDDRRKKLKTEADGGSFGTFARIFAAF